MVECDDGNCYIYFADFGELSSAPIDPTLAEALLQCYEWSPVSTEEWLTLDEIETRATTHFAGTNVSPEQASSGL